MDTYAYLYMSKSIDSLHFFQAIESAKAELKEKLLLYFIYYYCYFLFLNVYICVFITLIIILILGKPLLCIY